MNKKRTRDYNITVGHLTGGNRNMITDVEGVEIGHVTLDDGPVKTGVTALHPHTGDIFKEKLPAAIHVINGFGKSTGTIQIEELGTIETPIVLTNTLSVGVAYDALVDYMLDHNPEIGDITGTVNPVVCECNDGFLNDIRGKHVKKQDVLDALEHTGKDVIEGSVGAGTGMSCYGFKGGIGTASRVIEIENHAYTVGVHVLSNFGEREDLTLNGKRMGDMETESPSGEKDQGSIIVIVATDLPLTEHQLKRVIKRAEIGIARTGSFTGNGSGEVVIGFSTAVHIPHDSETTFTNIKRMHESVIDEAFRATAEATEEAILNSLVCSEKTTGRDGRVRESLKDYMHWFV